ncbi:MAG: hypothetical protein SFY80_10540 [Verrucomicrobiota bacterium]|nr:hypothetical protein [Verrucomicrobiota bacterium]
MNWIIRDLGLGISKGLGMWEIIARGFPVHLEVIVPWMKSR